MMLAIMYDSGIEIFPIPSSMSSVSPVIFTAFSITLDMMSDGIIFWFASSIELYAPDNTANGIAMLNICKNFSSSGSLNRYMAIGFDNSMSSMSPVIVVIVKNFFIFVNKKFIFLYSFFPV